jgi:hypothetical protein
MIPLHRPTTKTLLGAMTSTLLIPLLCMMPGCEELQQVADFIDSISDGAPCKDDFECLGGKCLTAQQGYPNGYCTTLSCEQDGCSGLFSECFRTSIQNKAVTACFELCNLDGSCDRASEGYTCQLLNDSQVCLPPGVGGAQPQGVIGAACSANPQCNGDGAVCLQSFFGGYCSVLECTGSADCPMGNPCVPLNPAGATDADKVFACMKGCEADTDCRFGYSCQDYQGARICLEADQAQPRNPDGADDGQPCASSINCKGGTCIREGKASDGSTSYPGGLCTTRDCATDEDCNGASAICVSRERTTACRVACQRDGDCRSGYVCRSNGTQSFCDSPVETAPVADNGGGGALQIQCSNSKTINFTVPTGAQGFFIAPFAKGNFKVTPTTLKKPDGSTLDIRRDYGFLAINPEILGNIAPLLFPASNRNEFKSAFGAGAYTLTVNTSASEVCYYVIPQLQVGTRLELIVHLVGVKGVTAGSAATDRNMQQIVRAMQSIYQGMGVTVSVAEYRDAASSVRDAYRIIRDFSDIYSLVATSSQEGGLNDVLKVNVFLIEDFNISDVPGLLGISTGIPGAAGLHGTSASGLVFSTASLGADNATLGQTMAHEIGHYLGLRHTTEHGGSAHDPITDTPECVSPDLAFICSDAENFMFPFSLGNKRQTRTTAGQAFVIQRNPLVR